MSAQQVRVFVDGELVHTKNGVCLRTASGYLVPLPDEAEVHQLPRDGRHHEALCAIAVERGLAEACLDSSSKPWVKAAKVIRSVNCYLPGQPPLGLREGMTLGKAVVAALDGDAYSEVFPVGGDT